MKNTLTLIFDDVENGRKLALTETVDDTFLDMVRVFSRFMRAAGFPDKTENERDE